MVINQLAMCEECRNASCAKCKAFAKAQLKKKARQAAKDMMKSLGLTPVKGAVSGRSNWE